MHLIWLIFVGHASDLFEWVVLNRWVKFLPRMPVGYSTNKTQRSRYCASWCEIRYIVLPARASERRTIGSRSCSAVCTNEVAPYSRILQSAALDGRWIVLTLARYFPRASTLGGVLLSNSTMKPLFSRIRAYNLNLIPCSSRHRTAGDLFVKSRSRFIKRRCVTAPSDLDSAR